MKISQKSWHYQLVTFFGLAKDKPANLCTYFWTLVRNLIFSLLVIGILPMTGYLFFSFYQFGNEIAEPKEKGATIAEAREILKAELKPTGLLPESEDATRAVIMTLCVIPAFLLFIGLLTAAFHPSKYSDELRLDPEDDLATILFEFVFKGYVIIPLASGIILGLLLWGNLITWLAFFIFTALAVILSFVAAYLAGIINNSYYKLWPEQKVYNFMKNLTIFTIVPALTAEAAMLVYFPNPLNEQHPILIVALDIVGLFFIYLVIITIIVMISPLMIKIGRVITGPDSFLRLLRHYLTAKKEKVCPLIEYQNGK